MKSTYRGVVDLRWGLPQSVLSAWAFGNPIEALRIAVIASMDPDVSLLGPVGATWAKAVGSRGAIALSFASLLSWTAVPTAFGWWWFRRPRAWSALA